ncbi:hypothetical protein [Goodfellowiella coeruleoviolacea]|nr:hypothetical protein [Goodfellowiella coeruleoviolacea]
MYELAVICEVPNDMASIRAANNDGVAMWNSLATNADSVASSQPATRS